MKQPSTKWLERIAPDEEARFARGVKVMGYPDVPASFRKLRFEDRPPPVLTLDYIVGGRSLSVFTTIATLGTPQDITLQELRVESFFPMDRDTAATLRRWAG